MTDNLSIEEHDEKNYFMTHLKKLALLGLILILGAVDAVAVFFQDARSSVSACNDKASVNRRTGILFDG